VLDIYEQLISNHGDELAEVLEPSEIDGLETRTSQLSRLQSLFAEVDELDRGDNAAITVERAQWEAYVAQADSVRNSPAKAYAGAIVDSLRTIETEYATLVSLYLCSTGGLDCPERLRVETIAQGQRVFFSVKVTQPTSGTIRWEWRGPDGSIVGEGNASMPASSSGYRTYKYFDAESTGDYELRVYNSQGHLIGRRTFVVY